MSVLGKIASWLGGGLGGRGSGGSDPASKRKGMLYYSGYDATKPRRQRQPGSGVVRDEDKELPQAPRRVAVSGIRDGLRWAAKVFEKIRQLDVDRQLLHAVQVEHPDAVPPQALGARFGGRDRALDLVLYGL